MRFVKIKSNGKEFIHHIPRKWNNSEVKQELGDLFPIERVTSIPASKVSKREKSEVFKTI